MQILQDVNNFQLKIIKPPYAYYVQKLYCRDLRRSEIQIHEEI